MSQPSQRSEVPRRIFLGASALAVIVPACTTTDDSQSGGVTAPNKNTSNKKTATTTPRDGSDPKAAESESVLPLKATDFDELSVCKLLPEQMAGPFPLDEQFNRRDITEGYPGQPMRLGLRVVDESCLPIPGAVVEVWHCDATGDYSAFIDDGGGKDEGPGTTFLRGTQTAGDDGIVEFQSIVPGWYRGRAVHVHLRVRLGGDLVLTSQMYFDADYLARVYESEPYEEFGLPDTSNEADSIAGDPASDGTMLHTVDAPTTAGAGTLALLNLGVIS